jgi:serine/threonine protein kinase
VTRSGTLELNEVRNLARQLISAVAHLHRNQVCHRDLKPDNILVQSQSSLGLQLKVIDLNVAVNLQQTSLIHGKTGLEGWSAPETRKWVAYDQKCDMWSVGCLLVYMLTGKQPITDWTTWSESLVTMNHPDTQLSDLLNKLLESDPEIRISSTEAAAHPWLH